MVGTLNIVIVLLLVLANGFFVATEFSLVGVRRSRIATLADAGNKRAKLLLELLDNLNAYISATQLGITLSSLALGWIGEPAVAHLLEIPLKGRISETLLHTIAFTIAFSIITFLHIVLGELAPKTLALERAEKTALAVALPIQIFYKVFSYPIRVLDWAGTRTVRLFGLHPSGDHASIYTEDELRQLIDVSRRSGHLEVEEQKLINRILDFSDAEVREAMIPQFIPATVRLGAALRHMQTSRTHLSIVIDEHGGLEGIVTLEDLLEEIVGEINDEYDEEVRSQILKEANGTYLLSGMLTVRDANRQLKLNLPEGGGYITLAGFLLAQAGRLLQEGETVEYEGMLFKVERVDKRRIRRVRFTPSPDEKQMSALALLPFLGTSLIDGARTATSVL